MSENIPESIPTSSDPRSRRPTKKVRLPDTPTSKQSAAVTALFEKQPLDREIYIPSSATAGPKTAASLAPPPEIVANVQGSSAGAGSGEFHVYKAARRREYERIRLMEEESKREEADQEWEKQKEANKNRDDAKRSKNAKKREKAKARKANEKKESDDVTGKTTQKGKNGIDLTAGRPVDLNGDGDAEDENKVMVNETKEEQGIIIHDED